MIRIITAKRLRELLTADKTLLEQEGRLARAEGRDVE